MRPEKSLLGLWVLTCVAVVLQAAKGKRNTKPSEECSFNGFLTDAGSCQCFGGYVGLACAEIAPSARMCMRADDQYLCSGRGECIESNCECYKRKPNSAQKYSGQFCECDDYSCPVHNGHLCGGLSKGFCSCGRCECKPTYTGDDCSCSVLMNNCTSKIDGSICNNRGKCECNKCECEDGFLGSTCQENVNKAGVCEEYKDCVQCRIHQTGLDPSICYNNPKCSNQRIMTVDRVSDNKNLCEYVDETDSCIFYFSYAYDNLSRLTIEAQSTKVCPELNAVVSSQLDNSDTSKRSRKADGDKRNVHEDDEEGDTSAANRVPVSMATVLILILTLLCLSL